MQTSKQLIGKLGEQHAKEFLEQNDYRVLEQNFRVGRSEVDLICEKNGDLYFIEVKTRSSTDFGLPETFVSEAQCLKIQEAADVYLDAYRKLPGIQFDIIAVQINEKKELVDLRHFEDAF